MKWLLKIFTDHPSSVNETYLQHFLVALKISIRFGIACLSQLTHGILPFVHPPFGSDIKSLSSFLDGKCTEKRSKGTKL
jgi:hypothetical protein